MKKIVYFIPVILWAIVYGFLMYVGLNRYALAPGLLYPFVLFVTSGILLAKGLFWGGLPGVIPGIHFMYMSTIETGQVIAIEMPLGIVLVSFYLICSWVLFVRRGRAG
jgi:hypothetical protein